MQHSSTLPKNPRLATPKRVLRTLGNVQVRSDFASFTLTNARYSLKAEIVLDYGRCEGGFPVFSIASASALKGQTRVAFQATYSETIDGIEHEQGDGPFFLFSNAMDSYRTCLHQAQATNDPQTVQSRFIQASQRYQKITLTQPDATLVFSKIGFQAVRNEGPIKASFHCSNEAINRIWQDGVRTVDLCTVDCEETVPAWDVIDQGTRVFGGHWAPCRQGTRWSDKRVKFQTRIEKLGASWGVHIVANGFIFCLDIRNRKLSAFEGLSNQSSIMPSIERGSWHLPEDLDLSGWLSIETLAIDDQLTVLIQDHEVASISNVQVKSMLGDGVINIGSVAFGGPLGWTALYRDLRIESHDGQALYENSFLQQDAERTYADFQVGTNKLPCFIDGAKRDRACFGGDVFVTGRSAAYSTANLDAWKSSIQLLLSHQTKDGYLGNLCPIQAPEHDSEDEPPVYSFYSLTYALLLVVSVKDYWHHSGDWSFVERCLHQLERQMEFTKNFLNSDGLVEAPPHLSMTWFPMGGPIFGASAGLNIAYYDALKAMALMSLDEEEKFQYLDQAQCLKDSLVSILWNDERGTFRPSLSLPVDGCFQDVNAYAATMSITPEHISAVEGYNPSCESLPPAFRGLGHWDKFELTSPYASGFALEALFTKHEGLKAKDLLLRVWGLIAKQDDSNYSGAHWEAMRTNGAPFNHDVSLAHGWSTWPVFLLPRYLAGVYPLEPGWKKIGVEPILAGLDVVEYSLQTPQGYLKIILSIKEQEDAGLIKVLVPQGVTAVVKAPNGWLLLDDGNFQGDRTEVSLRLRRV